MSFLEDFATEYNRKDAEENLAFYNDEEQKAIWLAQRPYNTEEGWERYRASAQAELEELSEYPDVQPLLEHLHWEGSKPVSFDGLGKLTHVDSYGGEGKGEDYWVVFSYEHDGQKELYRVDGYWASWDGSYWEDPEPYKVVSKEVTSIEYAKE